MMENIIFSTDRGSTDCSRHEGGMLPPTVKIQAVCCSISECESKFDRRLISENSEKQIKHTPVLFLLVSTRDTVKVAARLGELSTSRRATRHSPRNL